MAIGAEPITIISRSYGAAAIGPDGRPVAPAEVETAARATWEPVQGTTTTVDADGKRRQVHGTWIIWELSPEVVPADQDANIPGDRIRDTRGRLFEVIGSTSYPALVGVCPHQEAQVKRVYS